MELWIISSSVVLALVSLSLLGRKWQIRMRTVIPGALVIGILTGVAVILLNSRAVTLGIATSIVIELVLIFALSFLILLIRFYRDPERTPLETENVILSPADGEVIYVRKAEQNSSIVSTKGEDHLTLNDILATDAPIDVAYLVAIGMNMLNVHVNRAPIAGKIVLQKHINGQFMSLSKSEAEALNERVATVIDNGRFRVIVIQIASRLVRKILSYHKEGETVGIGERIGMIRLGSQVDVTIPNLKNIEVNVHPGDRVTAGVSVVARYQ